jgi:hypothetical protein
MPAASTRPTMAVMSAAVSVSDELYRARRGTPVLVEVPAARFLAIDGVGSPDREEFQQAIGALYSIVYTAKFALKRSAGVEVKLTPLEGLYDVGRARYFDARVRERLRWTLMLRLPAPLDDELVERARTEAARKHDSPALGKAQIRLFDEGLSAQVLHVGPYAEEQLTIQLLLDFIAARGYRPRGFHHEIYLGDPRRARPERLKTILRQPVASRAGSPGTPA